MIVFPLGRGDVTLWNNSWFNRLMERFTEGKRSGNSLLHSLMHCSFPCFPNRLNTSEMNARKNIHIVNHYSCWYYFILKLFWERFSTLFGLDKLFTQKYLIIAEGWCPFANAAAIDASLSTAITSLNVDGYDVLVKTLTCYLCCIFLDNVAIKSA